MVNFREALFSQISLLLVLICWTTCSTGAAFSLEEEFLQLKENYIQMKEVVKSLESKSTQLELKVIQLESNDVQMKETVTELEAKVEQQDSLLTSLLREKNERAAANGFNPIPISTNVSAVAINGLPSSCGDLKMIGHTLNGFYSVLGSSMIESVYCDFTKLPDDAGFQKLIGYVDVKSTPVHFYVQSNSDFSTLNTPIPFNFERLNEGNAMDLSSGIFTAPRQGIYFFSFTGHAYFQQSASEVEFAVSLYLNNDLIGTWEVEEANTTSGQFTPLTLQSTLNLKQGDRVYVTIPFMTSGTFLHGSTVHYTHFTGFLLEEEIVASL